MDTVSSDRTVTMLVLQVAVPPWLDRLRLTAQGPGDLTDTAVGWARQAVTLMTDHPDVLRPDSDRAAWSFGVLARGIAALAILPGGVVFGDRLWCALHAAEGREAARWEAVCWNCVNLELLNSGAREENPLIEQYRLYMRAARSGGGSVRE